MNKFNELYESLTNNLLVESKNDLTGSYQVNITAKPLQNVFNKALKGEEFKFYIDLDGMIFSLSRGDIPLEDFDIKGRDVIQTSSGDFSRNRLSFYYVYVKLSPEQEAKIQEFSKTGNNFINTKKIDKSMSLHDGIRNMYDKNTLTYMKEQFKISKFQNVKRKNETLQEAVNRYISEVLATMLKIQNKKMGGVKDYKPKSGEYYHVSYNDYGVGDSIIPTRTKKELEDMGKGTMGANIALAVESVLEDHRPSSKPPRIGSVFLFESSQDAQNWFRKFSHAIPSKIYVVKPKGKTHRANMLLVDAIESEFGDLKELGQWDEEGTEEATKRVFDEMDNIAKAYWAGKDGKEWTSYHQVIWEIVANSAEVIKVL